MRDNVLLNMFIEREVLSIRLELIKERKRVKEKKIKELRNYKQLKERYDEIRHGLLNGELKYSEVAEELQFLNEQLTKIKDEIDAKTAKEKNVSKELNKIIKKQTETIRNVLVSAGILDMQNERAKVETALDSDNDKDVLVIFSSPIRSIRGAVDVKGAKGV